MLYWNFLFFSFWKNKAGQEILDMAFGCNKWMHVVLFFDHEKLESELYINLKVLFISISLYPSWSISS